MTSLEKREPFLSIHAQLRSFLGEDATPDELGDARLLARVAARLEEMHGAPITFEEWDRLLKHALSPEGMDQLKAFASILDSLERVAVKPGLSKSDVADPATPADGQASPVLRRGRGRPPMKDGEWEIRTLLRKSRMVAAARDVSRYKRVWRKRYNKRYRVHDKAVGLAAEKWRVDFESLALAIKRSGRHRRKITEFMVGD
jgi:hypothetical protein